MILKTKVFPVLLAALLAQSPVMADDDQDKAHRLRQQGTILPLEKIIQAARNIHPGRIVEAELDRERGVYVYEIEIVDNNGRVWEMKFNAKDATLISSEQED